MADGMAGGDATRLGDSERRFVGRIIVGETRATWYRAFGLGIAMQAMSWTRQEPVRVRR